MQNYFCLTVITVEGGSDQDIYLDVNEKSTFHLSNPDTMLVK